MRILQEMATVQGRIKGRIKEDLERATNVSNPMKAFVGVKGRPLIAVTYP